MAEVILDVHDSTFEVELKCVFDVKPPTLEDIVKKLEKEIRKLEENKSG